MKHNMLDFKLYMILLETFDGLQLYFSSENVTKLVQTLQKILNLSTINAKRTNLKYVRTSLRPVSYVKFNILIQTNLITDLVFAS
jgi:hypothetical protein